MDRRKIGFVVGLNAEARLLRNRGFMIGIGGGTPSGAADAAMRLLDAGAESLVSFGLAGGLNSELQPGHILVPQSVTENGVSYACDEAMAAWFGGFTAKSMLAGAEIAVTAAAKSALFAQTNADAVDLESGAVARVAASRGVPFAVLRAVADPAWRDLPPAALIALNAAGKISILAVLASVLRHPCQIPELMSLASCANRAREALQGKLHLLIG